MKHIVLYTFMHGVLKQKRRMHVIVLTFKTKICPVSVV